MITSLNTSWWGIKHSGDDISSHILAILDNASAFIVVGGYNFTFPSSAGSRPFFDLLLQKVRSGVPVMMIFPPSLHGRHNPQPAIINYCLSNGIGVILNHQNHSKWLLTETQMYYGSSNFTTASWGQRVEVVSLHDHADIPSWWSRETIKDFYDFIRQEMTRLREPARRMRSYRGLLTLTRTAWNRTRPLIRRLNPSIAKVKETLSNYDDVQAALREPLSSWFDQYEPPYFERLFDLSATIAVAIDDLCSYAYAHIYNETIEQDNTDLSPRTIDAYNALHEKALLTIDSALSKLPPLESDEPIQSQWALSNLDRLSKTEAVIIEYLKPYLG